MQDIMLTSAWLVLFVLSKHFQVS